jgi:hypothetical protein
MLLLSDIDDAMQVELFSSNEIKYPIRLTETGAYISSFSSFQSGIQIIHRVER